MKTMTKRIVSAALAVMMAVCVLASAVPTKAFAAAPTGTLTVTSTNAEFNGKEVKIWKMFDITVGGGAGTGNESYGYTIDTDWKQFFVDKSADFKLGLTQNSTDAEVSAAAYDYVSKLGKKDAPEVTAFAKAARDWALAKSLADDGTQSASGTNPYTATFSNLAYGYYVVSPVMGSTSADRGTDAILVPVKDANATITLKSEYPTVDKTVADKDKVSAEIGKEITFKLTAKVPDVSEYTKYQFAFKDTLSKGLTFGSFTHVTIGGQTLTSDTEYKAEAGAPDQATGATSISIKFGELSENIYDAKKLFTDKAGQEIVVEYTAYLNADAVVGQAIPNTATVEYSNNPDGTSVGTSTTDVTHQYDFGFQLKKTDEAGTTPLAGAEFALRHEENGADIDLVMVTDGVYRLKMATDNSSVTTVATGTDGIIKFQGLSAGTYYLVETKAPDGFNKLAKPIKLVVSDTTADGTNPSWTVAMNDGQARPGSKDKLPEVQVKNKKGILLPETGGIGTVLFTLGGAALIAYGVYRKRTAKTTA